MIFHRAQKFSFISCLRRACISVKEPQSQNTEYELKRLSSPVKFLCLSYIFWCWSCETTAVRSAGLYASLISLYIMIYDYSEDLDVIQLGLFCEEFACPPKGPPSVRSSHNRSARLQWKLQFSWEYMSRRLIAKPRSPFPTDDSDQSCFFMCKCATTG